MKKITACLFVLAATVFSLFAAEVPLTGKNFILGDRNECGVKYKVTYENDILRVDIPKTPGIGNATFGAVLNVDPKKMVGMGVNFRCEVRYSGIETDTKTGHNGGKILATNCSDGVYTFFGTPPMLGTQTEWKPLSLDCTFRADQKSAHVVFGMQQAWGTIEFRNIFYETFPIAPITKVKVPKGFKQQYTARVTKDVPRRGVMSPGWGHVFCEQDVEDLASWNVNLVRYQIVDGLKDATDEKEYVQWFTAKLDHIEKLMPLMKKYDIKVIIDMHSVAGGRYGKTENEKLDGSHFRAFHEKKYKDLFIRCWKMAAKRFKGNKTVYAFDLCNEPIQHGAVPCSFWDLQYDVAREIRKIDPEVPIMIESNHMANPTFFEMEPMPLKNIIYTIHMYSPGPYVFQGIETPNQYSADYAKHALPYSKTGWDRAKLAESMKLVREFQLKYGARIEVGEFSVINWAPGGADYLNDLVSIFEEYHWDWTYHAFREWPGWSLEHTGLPNKIVPAEKDTDRKLVMLKYFGKNKKPDTAK